MSSYCTFSINIFPKPSKRQKWAQCQKTWINTGCWNYQRAATNRSSDCLCNSQQSSGLGSLWPFILQSDRTGKTAAEVPFDISGSLGNCAFLSSHIRTMKSLQSLLRFVCTYPGTPMNIDITKGKTRAQWFLTPPAPKVCSVQQPPVLQTLDIQWANEDAEWASQFFGFEDLGAQCFCFWKCFLFLCFFV